MFCLQDLALTIASSIPAVTSVQDLLVLQEGAIANCVWNGFTAVCQLLEICMLVFATCVSMTLVAQQKAERNPNLPWQQLFVTGGLFGALFSIFSGWNWLTMPVLAALAGATNIFFPYRFYMAEIQKDPAAVAAETSGDEPATLTSKMKKHVLIGLGVGAGLVVCNLFTLTDKPAGIDALVTSMFGFGSWMQNLTQAISFTREQRFNFQVRLPGGYIRLQTLTLI